MNLRIDGSNFFPDDNKSKDVSKKPLAKSELNIGELLAKKTDFPEIKRIKPSGSLGTAHTNPDGTLKEGVSPSVALEEDGTLKKGWIVDPNGQPRFIGEPKEWWEHAVDFPKVIDGHKVPQPVPMPTMLIRDNKDLIEDLKKELGISFESNEGKKDMASFLEEMGINPDQEIKLPDEYYEKRGYEKVPKYELQDGKLVPVGYEWKPGQNTIKPFFKA